MVMQYLCIPPYLCIVYLLLYVKPLKFKLEESPLKHFKFKSLFLDKSLKKVVFEFGLRNKVNLDIYIYETMLVYIWN